MHVTTAETAPRTDTAFLADMLRGYRFGVCETPWQAERALDVRRRVYVDGSGYDLPVPDRYDRRSWLLRAEDAGTGEIVGSMRLTPRIGGPFEAEEYLDLPDHLRTPKAVELSRFAILPGYRKGRTFLPVVSLGLFKTVQCFLKRIEADYMVICARPERLWTYEWLRFRRTGISARYEALGGTVHELLAHEFHDGERVMSGHPFDALFHGLEFREVALPRRIPPLGLGGARAVRHLQLAMGA